MWTYLYRRNTTQLKRGTSKGCKILWWGTLECLRTGSVSKWVVWTSFIHNIRPVPHPKNLSLFWVPTVVIVFTSGSQTPPVDREGCRREGITLVGPCKSQKWPVKPQESSSLSDTTKKSSCGTGPVFEGEGGRRPETLVFSQEVPRDESCLVTRRTRSTIYVTVKGTSFLTPVWCPSVFW